jgi:hypothetical protein
MPMVRAEADLDVVIEILNRAFRQYVQLAQNKNHLHSQFEPLPEAVFEEEDHGSNA